MVKSRFIPPPREGGKISQADKPPNQANTKADEGGDNEHFQQGIRSDSRRVLSNPADSSRHNRSNVSNNRAHGFTSFPVNRIATIAPPKQKKLWYRQINYNRISRRIRPTPRPTKDTITNMRISGLLVIAPTKLVSQVTDPLTKLPTSPTIVDTSAGAGVAARKCLSIVSPPYIHNAARQSYHD